MSNSGEVFCSCCTYLTLSLKMDQFLISRDLSSLSKKLLFMTTFLIWVVTLILHHFKHHCLHINNISLFYSFVYIFCLFFSQAHGFFVMNVVDKNEVVPFLPFISLNILFLPWSQWDNSLESSFVEDDGSASSQSGSSSVDILGHSDAKVIVFPTSIAPYTIMVGTYPGVGPEPRVISSSSLKCFVWTELAYHNVFLYFYLLHSHYCTFQFYLYL